MAAYATVVRQAASSTGDQGAIVSHGAEPMHVIWLFGNTATTKSIAFSNGFGLFKA
ncbi:MAG: hypothetical protein Q9173_003020 [Seirophora scorigena]